MQVSLLPLQRNQLSYRWLSLTLFYFHSISYSYKIKFKMTTNGTAAVAALQLPIFDISDPTPEVGRSMIEAAAKYGFLYVDTKGTDFTEAIVDRQFEMVFGLSLMAPRKRTDACAPVQEILLLSSS
jgi:hypothetical protein